MEQIAADGQFTANAAYELRTPLAILTAGLQDLTDGQQVDRLRDDDARIYRLVEQLSRVARLDGVPIDLTDRVYLVATVAAVLEHLSPWAVSLGCTLGFDPPCITRAWAAK